MQHHRQQSSPACRSSLSTQHDSTAFDPEAQTRRELAKVSPLHTRHSALHTPHSVLRIRRAYTLVEFFVTIAVLIILMGLMVDLANRVRRNSANRLTRQLLRQVDVLMADYLAHNAGQLPPIAPLLPPRDRLPTETALHLAAARNNADFVRLLRGQYNLSNPGHTQNDPHALLRNPLQDVFAGLPLSLYDELTLHDPWGSPLVFMPQQDPRVGTAPGGRFFFFSAGPDRAYLTREDNLYSYELPDPLTGAPR